MHYNEAFALNECVIRNINDLNRTPLVVQPCQKLVKKTIIYPNRTGDGI